MSCQYTQNATMFKALADKNRLKIMDLLSNGEKCACGLLEKFDISQPTLSHHMKILCDCNLVSHRRDGKMTMYSLNGETLEKAKECLCITIGNYEDCICDDDCDCKDLHQ